MRLVALERPLPVALGSRTYDVSSRALVMGILNRTKDSFFAPAATYDLDAFFRRAEQLVREGADLLDVGGVKAGPGDEVSESEELERVVPVIGALRERFDVPLSVDTWRASVARESFRAGASLGNDISGFADPDYLPAAAAAGASVVATHIRLRPRVADPEPVYENVTTSVREFLLERRAWAHDAGLSAAQVILDAGLDLGKTARHSLQLLRESDQLATLGSPLLLSASNKTFLGVLLDQSVSERRESSLAASALGIASGCRIVRVHDVAGTVRVRNTLSALLERDRR
ncbi:MAG TPA: dihydropteroate synthase [Acidimicrobiales bacterium]|nr:MAG: dihydropteroate synthase [Actinobacteria bacterium 21-64-8]HQT99051.1 dihydropteroate synthase [Acidimicrobiales bacterium]